MKPLKDRKTPLVSKRKLVAAVELFEKHVDEEIESIELYSHTSDQFMIKGKFNDYSVNVATNKVEVSYPDPEY